MDKILIKIHKTFKSFCYFAYYKTEKRGNKAKDNDDERMIR